MSDITIRIARGDGGARSDHRVEVRDGMTLLDALESIRGGGDRELRYRHSCHHGSCGTCGAIVNGKERLMCLTKLEELGPGPVEVEPLRKMDRVGDLAVDPAPFLEDWPEGLSYLRKSELVHGGELPAGGFRRMENCIECGICVSACPVSRPFLGPAVLAAADRDREERPSREEASLVFASQPDGVAACEKRFDCSRACPQSVAPGRRIESLRRSIAEKNSTGTDFPHGKPH